MRKRSTQEILEMKTAGGKEITSSTGRGQRVDAARRQVESDRQKREKQKPSIDQQRINQKERQLDLQQQEIDIKKDRQQKAEKRKNNNKPKGGSGGGPTATIKTKGQTPEKSSSKSEKEKINTGYSGGGKGDQSITATGKAAANTVKSAISFGKKVASANIPGRVKKSAQRINTAVTNTRRKAGRGIERFGKRLNTEDFIHEAEKDTSKEVEKDSSKEVKKKTIDVMKGKNAVEVNPTIKAEETMSPTQKRKDTNLKKKYDDSDMKQNMIDQYGEEEGMKVYYATIRKQAMKTESVLEVQDVSDGIKFREYEFIDVIKNEPMKSPKNNITWNEETINEISADLAGRAARTASKKYQYADSNETKSKAYKQTQKFATYADKKYRKLNKDKGDLNRIYNKPDAVKEAKMPVKGLVKLAAMVAANNKKRKNALQIQKYIGEGIDSESKKSPDAISGKDLKRTAALSGKMTRFGDGPEGTAKRKAALEKKRGMKLDDHPQFKSEGKGSNPNKRYIGDPVVTSKKSFSKTGKIGIDYYTDDEKKKSEKEKLKDAQNPKKNTSRERATQNMQMIKRMTPEEKFARNMRNKQQRPKK